MKKDKPFGTCSLCRRHRRLSGGESEKQMCGACTEGGMVSCPQCGGSMPAGYGKQCSTCYWQGLFQKRAEHNRFLFTSDTWKAVFEKYVNWLGERYDPKVAALRINGDAGFLADVASLGADIPTASKFIEAFPPSTLRHHLIVGEFLATHYNLRISEKDKFDAAERQRIKVLMAPMNGRSPAEQALRDYCNNIMKACHEGALSSRTVRLYLQAAVGLTTLTLKSKRDIVDPAILQKYLRERPGQRASVNCFAKHLGLHLASICKPLRSSARNEAKAVLRSLASTTTLDCGDQTIWNIAALQVYHSMSTTEAHDALQKATLMEEGEVIKIESDECQYIVPRHQRR